MQVTVVLAHELVHAAIGIAARHGKAFRRVASRIGLVGQMAATTAGPEFEKATQPILEAAGPLPHRRLELAIGASSHSNRRKKPSYRPIKCACSNCAYNILGARRQSAQMPAWLLERTGFEPRTPVDLVECILFSIHLAIGGRSVH